MFFGREYLTQVLRVFWQRVFDTKGSTCFLGREYLAQRFYVFFWLRVFGTKVLRVFWAESI